MLSKRRFILGLSGMSSLMLPLQLRAGEDAAKSAVGQIQQILQPDHRAFIKRAFEMRDLAVETGDQGYGAIVVRGNQIIGQSPSHVIVHNDPTAHAELEAIRDAARRIGSRDLSGCILYSSSAACPMCEAAAYWANIERLIYGNNASDSGRPVLC
ncbi:MAG: nucleoside deaminase [Gammaproteobacteria bacterium]|nr:nucleoside deaminase [Gammaproteobacteria bacterium]